MIRLSPGLIQGCIELLDISGKQQLSFAAVARSFREIGSIDASAVIEACQALNWLVANEMGIAEVTKAGQRLLEQCTYELKLRQALLDFVELARPPWAQNATFGRARVIKFTGSSVGQVLVEADLMESTADHVVAFWDELAARARGHLDVRLTDIGRKGERLTLQAEEKRTGQKPKWVSIENNADGYDVLSVWEAEDPRKLSIEVKTSTRGNSARFSITRNEWDTAKERDLHVFHLWNIQDPQQASLAVISTEEMAEHIPVDKGIGAWETVEIPFRAFAYRFTLIANAQAN